MFYFYSLSLIFAYIGAFFSGGGGDGGMDSLIISAIFRLLDHATKIEKARRSTHLKELCHGFCILRNLAVSTLLASCFSFLPT